MSRGTGHIPRVSAGTRVSLIGLGRSSLAAARLIRHLGGVPYISEKDDFPKLLPWKQACETLNIPLETGGHSDRVYEADLLLLSPGVPMTAPVVRASAERGIPITGELEFASRYCTAPMLAVTGTNGKTTTTILLRHVLSRVGIAADLAGNNDCPLSESVLDHPDVPAVVVEVSSYQLETAQTFHPVVAAVLNVTPDHLARHGTLEAYAAQKAQIFACQWSGDTAVLNDDDPWTACMTPPHGVRIIRFSTRRTLADGAWFDGSCLRLHDRVIARREDLRLPGLHNVANALAVAAMVEGFGLDLTGFAEALRSFGGVEHRIEWVAEINGAAWYNDSKSTNPDSLRIALEAFDRPVILIAGGQHKEGADYPALAPILQKKTALMIAMGDAAGRFVEWFGDLVPHCRVRNVEEAVTLAAEHTKPGSIVLFSPGCASFDQYLNFEERGRHFKQLVLRLAGRNTLETAL